MIPAAIIIGAIVLFDLVRAHKRCKQIKREEKKREEKKSEAFWS